MKTPPTQNFKKSKNCPPTCSLLKCSTAELSELESKMVLRHVHFCEFCAAELHFLSAHAPISEEVRTPEMPFQLRQLAEILLGGKHFQFKILNASFNKREVGLLKKTPLSV